MDPGAPHFVEVQQAGTDQEDWTGNGVAKGVAKWAAAQGGPPPALLAARAAERAQNESVLRAAGLVLLQRLKARPRAKANAPTKTCKRAAPGLPKRLRPAKRARVVVERAQRPSCS